MSKKEELEKLNKKIQSCKKCDLWKMRNNTVPGEGVAFAKVMFLGEAPGREEDLRGLPFVGPAGKFLDELLKIAKIDRKKVYITSVLKRNRPPRKLELDACKPWWQKQIEIIGPKLIVLLGKVAFDTIIKTYRGRASGNLEFGKFRGKFLILSHPSGKQKFFITYHPAAGMRFPKIKKVLIRDFTKFSKKFKLK